MKQPARLKHWKYSTGVHPKRNRKGILMANEDPACGMENADVYRPTCTSSDVKKEVTTYMDAIGWESRRELLTTMSPRAYEVIRTLGIDCLGDAGMETNANLDMINETLETIADKLGLIADVLDKIRGT